MARFSVGVKSATAGTAARALVSLYNIANFSAKLREAGIFNTTNTATDMKLVSFSTTGTQGAALTEFATDAAAGTLAALATAFNSHTVDATAVDGGYRAALGAAIGAGVIWTFGDAGVRAAAGTASGLGVTPADGATGQICQVYFVWDE